jgi:hypothetical protein
MTTWLSALVRPVRRPDMDLASRAREERYARAAVEVPAGGQPLLPLIR